MQTKLITNVSRTSVDVIQCSDGRTLMRFVEHLTWDITWYENSGEKCSWKRMDLDTEEYQFLNRDLMAALGQPVPLPLTEEESFQEKVFKELDRFEFKASAKSEGVGESAE